MAHPNEFAPALKLRHKERGATLFPWRRYRFPIDWPAQFGRAAPLHLEIGFGDGRYTAARAAAWPEEDFVGLEIAMASLQRALRRIKQAELSNVRLVKLGAEFAVRHLFMPQALATITVNFPDPWPKERHHRHRLLNQAFFRLAASRLAVGGALLLATDHEDYLAFARAEAAATGLYQLREAEPPPGVLQTKYALKWQAQGKPLFYHTFAVLHSPLETIEPLERSATMPHAILDGTLPDPLTLDKRVIPYGSGYVILHEALQSLSDPQRLVVRVTVDEPELQQQLLVEVRRRLPGELIVNLSPFGDPVVTEATHGAVHAVTEWLLTLATELRVVSRAYRVSSSEKPESRL